MKLLRILIVDAYSLQTRKLYKRNNMKLNSRLYEELLYKITSYPITITTIFIDDEIESNINVNKYEGVIWTGSSYNIYNSNSFIEKQKKICNECFIKKIPQFGSCWGLQLASEVCGGIVGKNKIGKREFGISNKITLTEKGKTHPMFRGKNTTFNALTSHEDELQFIPSNIKVLASNNHSYVQAICATKNNSEFWATQYHPEFNLGYLSKMIIARKERLLREKFFKNEEELLEYSNNLQIINKQPELINNRGQETAPEQPSLRGQETAPGLILNNKYGFNELFSNLMTNNKYCELKNWLDLLA